MAASGQEILSVLLANEVRADLVSMFRKNPGIIDSIDGVSRRIGRIPTSIQEDIGALVKLGVLKARKLGDIEIYSLDRIKDKDIQEKIGGYLQKVKPNSKGRV